MISNAAPLPAIQANGSAVPGYSLLVAGKDGSGNQQPFAVDSSGILQISVGGVAHDAPAGSVNPSLQGLYASATAPTAVSADGDMVHAWGDLNGRTAVWDGNTTLSIDDGAGTITIDDGGSSITVDGSVTVSGTVTANAGTGFPAVATAGSAVPATGLMAYGSDGTNAKAFLVDSSGRQVVVGPVAADAAASGAGNPLYLGGYASTATPSAMSADGDIVPLWLTRNGAVNIADGGGNISIDDGGNSITVDGAVTVSGTATVSGTVTANAGTGFPSVATAGSAVATTGYMAYGSDGTNARAISTDSSGNVNVKLPTASSAATKTVSVTSSATSILASSGTRKGFLMVNNSLVTTVYIGPANTVVEGSSANAAGGIALSPLGALSMDTFCGYTGDLYGITASGSAVVGVMYW